MDGAVTGRNAARFVASELSPDKLQFVRGQFDVGLNLGKSSIVIVGGNHQRIGNKRTVRPRSAIGGTVGVCSSRLQNGIDVAVVFCASGRANDDLHIDNLSDWKRNGLLQVNAVGVGDGQAGRQTDDLNEVVVNYRPLVGGLVVRRELIGKRDAHNFDWLNLVGFSVKDRVRQRDRITTHLIR